MSKSGIWGTRSVVVAEPRQSVEAVREMLENDSIGVVPVVDSEGRPVAIVSRTDLAYDLKSGTPIGKVMTERVCTLPRYDDTSIAMHVMPNHAIN